MRLRTLKQPVAFVYGSQVVELHPCEEGMQIVARRKHRERGVMLVVRELIAAGDQVRRPKGWVPQVGENVFVVPPPEPGNPFARRRRKATVTAVIERATELLIKIRYSSRGKERFMPYERLVPRDGILLIQCERTPKDGTTESEPTLFRPVA
jgi:hypothetical protein